MSLRSADLRFLLPDPPRTAWIPGELVEFARGFEQAGVTLTDRGADVAVVGSDQAARAIVSESAAVIVVGRRGRRALGDRMPVRRRFISLPGPLRPHLIVPVDRHRVTSYAIRNWASPESRVRRLRNAAAGAAAAVGALPDLPRSLTVGLADPAPPFVIAAAAPLGLPENVDWFLTLGLGDALTRAAFQLFAPGESEPGWVLKFARVPGYSDPFDRDERGLGLAASVGGTAAEHAPRLLGRFDADGLPASLEIAAVGQRLTRLLQSPGRRSQKRRAIDSVADWIVELGRETAAPPAVLAEERHRLESRIIPSAPTPVVDDLVGRTGDVPGVLQHNDLGCWNLVVGSSGFVAVDWESARRHGYPLWDLLYFLVDALIHLDGAWGAERRETHAARLLRGECDSSEILFRWVREAVESLRIRPSAVGAIATLGWLHHGLAARTREATADAWAPGTPSTVTFGEWMLRVWLREPGLGAGWTAWAA